MTSSPIQNTNAAPNTQKARKPYHTPRMEDYGAVNELTRSGDTPAGSDGPFNYSSVV